MIAAMKWKKMRRAFLYILFLGLSCQMFAQNQGNNWYFGNKAGIKFEADGTVTPLGDGEMSTGEGCASLSDADGNLMLYTDGVRVFNKNHQIMPNGDGLKGSPSSTHSAVVVPQPLSDSLLYIFTIDAGGGADGLNYSIVDMSLDNGLGDVAVKNFPLLSGPESEKISAVLHENGFDYWVITHGLGNNRFYAFEITSNGVEANPVVSEVGRIHNEEIGNMKLSPEGGKLVAVSNDPLLELFRFNKTTGVVSEPIVLPIAGNPYGAEFSPNGNLIYVGSNGVPNEGTQIYQYDIAVYDSTAIQDSRNALGDPQGSRGGFQLGPNGKLYIARPGKTFLAYIDQPDVYGAGANYVDTSEFTLTSNCILGLPTFIQSFFVSVLIGYENLCIGDTTQFELLNFVSEADSVHWDFGDPGSGALNTSTEFNPQHFYAQPGDYNVTTTVYLAGNELSNTFLVSILALPVVDIGPQDTSLCEGELLVLDATQPNASYLWQDGSNTPTYEVSSNGAYKVVVTVNGCSNSDLMLVDFRPLPNIDLPATADICEGELVTLSASEPADAYEWQDGSTSMSLEATAQGWYWLEATLDECTSRDSTFVNAYAIPEVNLGKDTALCNDEPITLDASQANATYLWQDGSTDAQYTTNEPGIYTVEVTINGCTGADEAELLPSETVSLGEDQELCDGEPTTLVPSLMGDSYLWQDGSSESTFEATELGTYWVEVTSGSCTYRDELEISYTVCDVTIPNVFSPNGDAFNEFFIIDGIEFRAFNLTILDRWGKVVYETDHYLNDWNGENVSEGIYYYVLSNSELELEYAGNLHLFR